eukprot:CAMPEP_0178441870 /NCGR_PEP_ID=MMETSP0689_2-20121128/37780_1 /TAXON_ID=160604 /ORGANISM="Amphidinium massartii, Strain CS-259" /LENGTH=135 /DNA_ID=CAMNT_0020065215 /DNA_START=41 /DNA_END=444 /DNA_ORIENTATION=-
MLREALRRLVNTWRWPPLAPSLAMHGVELSGPAAALSRVAAAWARATRTPGPADFAAAASDLFGFDILWMKSKKMRGVHGTLNPSLWRWYHRHGYWAQRRKRGVQKFGVKRNHKYHEVVGDGKRGRQYAKMFCQS